MSNLDRINFFLSLKNHPLRSKEMSEFNAKEYEYAKELIEDSADLSASEYALKINRLMISDPRVRKNRAIKLWGCLLEASSLEIQEGSK